MKKIIISLIFSAIGFCGYSQFHNNYSYSPPRSFEFFLNLYTDAVDITFDTYTGGCIVTENEMRIGTDNPPTQYVINASTGSSPFVTTTLTQTGLTPSTTYYFQVVTTNCLGVTFGTVLDFTTRSSGNPPTVLTSDATSIGQTTARINGNATSDGGTAITSRGFYWGTSSNPTTQVTSGNGTGTFFYDLSSLSPSTTYYFKAFATNSNGTSEGIVKSFQTLTPDGDPSVITTVATSITTTTAGTGGNVQYDGGSTLVERGVVYGTSANPTITGTKVTSGSGLGIFNLSLISLTPSTTYYYRAYAKNSTNEVGYGVEYSFTTLSAFSAPTVVTNAATSITVHGATLNGNVTSQGSSAVVSRGFVWSLTDSSPIKGETGVNNISNSSGGTGSYSDNIPSPIACGTIVYFNSYATNSHGTSYGTASSFTTTSENNYLSMNLITVYAGGSGISVGSTEASCTSAANAVCTYGGFSLNPSSTNYNVTSAAINGHYHYTNICTVVSSAADGWRLLLFNWYYNGASKVVGDLYVVHITNGIIDSSTFKCTIL